MKWFNKNSQIYSWFTPYPLLLGVFFSFIACSVIGRDLSHNNLFQRFHRFHYYISPESLFYPTARQLIELSEAKIPKSKIAVIIGGSSVFNGVGQSPQELWSRQLQRDLGSRYKVLNLAFRGGGIPEHGAIVAQMLLNKGYQVIYVADTTIQLIGSPDYRNENYRYIFWDAYYKGLIPGYEPRDRYLQTSLPPYSELRLNAQLNSVIYANDLWNSIGYEHLFTVWNFIAAGNEPSSPFYLPRKDYVDPEHRYKAKPLAERFSGLDGVGELSLLQSLCQNSFAINDVGQLVEADNWQNFEKLLKVVFPEEFAKRSLIVVMHRNPYYFDQLSEGDRDCLNRAFSLTSEKFRLAGYSSIEAGENFEPNDYNDQVHLVASGGRKLSAEVAAEVRRIARKLGYEK